MNSRPALETDQPYELKNAPLRPRDRQELLERDTTYAIQSDTGEVILAYEQGQQRIWWGFRSIEDMRNDFPLMWPEVLAHLDRDHVDYVAMDIAGLPTRTWLDPLLQDADFAFFAEWMDMANPDISDFGIPEFPEGITMRKATEDDLQRCYAIWTEAYGDFGDGPATFDWLTDESEWAGCLEDEDGEVVAFAITGAVERGEGRILAAAVAPEAWGNGYGKLILGAATYALAAQGAVKASLRVRPDIKQGLRTCSELGFRHQAAGLEFRREVDEDLIQARRDERRKAGVKARFGGWR
ncbi:MAG: GNAT family N-acetyltransferase [Dehalococcoidia bacterium]|nr:GNAT family N-acetyltransferase [Dehalococcoidia bacterium]